MDSSRPGERGKGRERESEGQGKESRTKGGKYKKREASDKYCRCNKSQHETPWCFGKYLVLKENTFFFRRERREETYVHPQKSYTWRFSSCTFSHNINFPCALNASVRGEGKAKESFMLVKLHTQYDLLWLTTFLRFSSPHRKKQNIFDHDIENGFRIFKCRLRTVERCLRAYRRGLVKAEMLEEIFV